MSGEDAAYDKSASGKPLTLEVRDTGEDGRRFSPSTGRNKDAVREVFLTHMPQKGRILEIASGTGEHGAHITDTVSALNWTFTDIDPQGMESQRAWVTHAEQGSLNGPILVDASNPNWGEAELPAHYDGIFNANMIHIAPFAVAQGLLAGAGRVLRAGGKLMLYGPFARNGEIAPSNARFSEDLKRRDASWGVRDLDTDILPLASDAGLVLETVIEMPANNLSVIFVRN